MPVQCDSCGKRSAVQERGNAIRDGLSVKRVVLGPNTSAGGALGSQQSDPYPNSHVHASIRSEVHSIAGASADIDAGIFYRSMNENDCG